MSLTMNDITRADAKGMGGIKYFLIAQYEEGKKIDITASTGTAVIGTYLPADFKKIVCTKMAGNFTDVGTGTPAAGTMSYIHTVVIPIGNAESTKRAAVTELGKTECIIVAVQRNGESVILGADNGLDLTTAEGGSGTAGADISGYNLTFTGEEPTTALKVTLAEFEA